MAYGYNYGGYPTAGGYYAPPMPDQLAQLRGAQMPPAQPVLGQTQQMPVNPQPVQPMGQMQPMAQPYNNSMIWVQGEAGAKSYLVANGNTVPLWDSENQTVYLKTVDASGMPSMRILDYTERTEGPRPPAGASQTPGVEYVTRGDFDRLAARADALARELEELKARKNSYGKRPAVKEEEVDG